MGQEWFYNRGGEQRGPLSAAELKQLAAAGKLRPEDHVWKEGMAKWLPARSIKGLFPVTAAATPAGPSPASSTRQAASPLPAVDGEPHEGRPMQAATQWAGGRWAAAKAAWGKATMPVKAGIIAGAGVVAVVVLAVPVVLLMLLLSGGQSASQGRPAGLTGSETYTSKAFSVAGEQHRRRKDVKDYRAGTKDDFIQALAVLGCGQPGFVSGWQDAEVFGQKVRRYTTLATNLDGDKWVRVFGELKDVSKVVDFAPGGMDVDSKKWTQQCSDGKLTVWGQVWYNADGSIRTVLVNQLTDP